MGTRRTARGPQARFVSADNGGREEEVVGAAREEGDESVGGVGLGILHPQGRSRDMIFFGLGFVVWRAHRLRM